MVSLKAHMVALLIDYDHLCANSHVWTVAPQISGHCYEITALYKTLQCLNQKIEQATLFFKADMVAV